MEKNKKKLRKIIHNGLALIDKLDGFQITYIFSFCTPQELCTFSSTCKLMRQYAKRDILKLKIEFGLVVEQPITGDHNGKTRILPVECPSCHKICSSARLLKIHIKESTTCSFPYECPRCKESFAFKNSRSAHMKQRGHVWTHAEQNARQQKHDRELAIQRKIDAANFPNNPEINAKLFEITKKISTNKSDIVYKGKLGSKIVQVFTLKNVVNTEEFLAKPCTLFNIDNEYVARFVGASKSLLTFHVVYEFFESKTLYEYIRTSAPLKLEEIKTISTAVARAMQCLHNQNPPVMHGDLRTANILIDKNKRIKIIGYGLNELYPKRIPDDALPYAAHEISETGITQASDVYSFAMVMYAMLHSHEPFGGLGLEQISSLLGGHQQPAISAKIPMALFSLLTMCMAHDTSFRPNFQHIVTTLERKRTWKFAT